MMHHETFILFRIKQIYIIPILFILHYMSDCDWHHEQLSYLHQVNGKDTILSESTED